MGSQKQTIVMDDTQQQYTAAAVPQDYVQPMPAPVQITAALTTPMSAEIVTAAAKAEVANHWFWNSKVVNNMTVQSVVMSDAYELIVQSFVETRRTMTDCEPYRGGAILQLGQCIAPGPWQINLPEQQPQNFHDRTMYSIIPYTDRISGCFKCNSRGTIDCTCCYNGRKNCSCCHGSGRNEEGSCHHCGGDGKIRCHSCGGDGRKTCPKCQGARQLKYFEKVEICFKTVKNNFIHEETDLPDHLISNVVGDTLHVCEGPLVPPVFNFPIQAVNTYSMNFLQNQMTQGRLWWQKIEVKNIPVSEDNIHRLFVYGRNQACWFDEYPIKCCCC